LFSGLALGVNGDMGGPGRDGSEAHPYLIEDVNDFDTFADPANAATYWAAGVHTKLATDIDLSGRTYTTAVIAPDVPDTDWLFNGISFSGNFDGNLHTIRNVKIITDYKDYIGLFGYIQSPELEPNYISVNDLFIDIFQISNSDDCVGGLAGYLDCATIKNCKVQSGHISGDKKIGGLVGLNNEGKFSDCEFFGNIIGATFVGGLVGDSSNGKFSFCKSTGTVHGANLVGGLIGWNGGAKAEALYCSVGGKVIGGGDISGGLIGHNEGLIEKCIATNAVDCGIGGILIGGLTGDNNQGTIVNSYAIGNVTGGNRIGGLVGVNSFGTIINCYSSGTVSSYHNSAFGGLIGDSDGTITSCYFLNTAGPDNGYGTPLDDPNMMIQANFVDWDFSDDDGDPAVWMMLREGEDYPRLAWQETFMGDIAGLYGVDLVDFARLAGQWNEPVCNASNQWCQGADIDHADGVDIKDLAAVAADWLR
jgi:hypothetical protein